MTWGCDLYFTIWEGLPRNMLQERSSSNQGYMSRYSTGGDLVFLYHIYSYVSLWLGTLTSISLFEIVAWQFTALKMMNGKRVTMEGVFLASNRHMYVNMLWFGALIFISSLGTVNQQHLTATISIRPTTFIQISHHIPKKYPIPRNL